MSATVIINSGNFDYSTLEDAEKISDGSKEPLWDIFLCHSSDDRKETDILDQSLTESGFEVFYSPRDAQGLGNYRSKLNRGKQFSKYKVFFVTESFLKKYTLDNSSDVQREVNFFLEMDKELKTETIIPVLYGVNRKDFRFYFPDLASVDNYELSKGESNDGDELFTEKIRNVVRDIKTSLSSSNE